MINDPVLLDVTSLLAAPIRSGIQRVERELIRHWPEPERLVLVALDPSDRIFILPQAVRAVLCPDAGQPPKSVAEDQRELARLRVHAAVLPDGVSGHLLNLELFFDRWRTDVYLRRSLDGWRVQWFVYDFMPWLHPELFSQGTSKTCMEYIRALRQIPEVAFASQQTAREYMSRVMRGHGRPGPVLPLGADGLGLEPQTWSPDRRDILMLGTIEKRKNIGLVMDAFRALWRRGWNMRLVMAGRISVDDQPQLEAFAEEAGSHRLLILDHATDMELRAALRQARVLLFASAVEGFGLPPYEALHSGIPAIAAATLPSLQPLPPLGQIRLQVITRDSLADAIEKVMDDEIAAHLWAEAATLDLPSWRDFAGEMSDWTHQTPGRDYGNQAVLDDSVHVAHSSHCGASRSNASVSRVVSSM